MFKKLIKFLGIILLFFVVIVDIMFLTELKKADGNPAKAAVSVLKDVADNVTESKPIYVLLLGENKDLGQTLTDTIMCLGYNGKNLGNARAQDKINSIYSEKNPKKMLDKVNELTGLDIEYYVTINNKALIKLVDIIGGVEFDVPIDMNYDDKSQNLHIHLKKGVQVIDGKKAEMLLRFRHNNNGTTYSQEYGDNDFGRMRTRKRIYFSCLKSDFTGKKCR